MGRGRNKQHRRSWTGIKLNFGLQAGLPGCHTKLVKAEKGGDTVNNCLKLFLVFTHYC